MFYDNFKHTNLCGGSHIFIQASSLSPRGGFLFNGGHSLVTVGVFLLQQLAYLLCRCALWHIEWTHHV